MARRKRGNKTQAQTVTTVSKVAAGPQNRRPKQTVTTVTTVSKKPKSNSNPRPRIVRNEKDLLRYLWCASLINPFTISGARIPDQLVSNTSTMQLKDRFSVTPLQDGTTGNYACGVQFIPTILQSYALATGYSNSTAAGTITFPAAGSFTSFTQNGTANTVIGDYRIVSAGLAVYATTAMATNQGHNLCVFEPSSDRKQLAVGGVVQLNQLNNYPYTSDSPVNLQKICSISWVPSDESNYDYHLGTVTPTGATFSTIYMPGKLSWYAVGIASTASFICEVVANYEYHPTSGAINIVNTSPSIYDSKAMEYALNHPVNRNTFHHVPADAVYSSTGGSNSSGINSILTNAMSSFGNQLYPALQKFTGYIGRTLSSPAFQESAYNYLGAAALNGVPKSLMYDM